MIEIAKFASFKAQKCKQHVSLPCTVSFVYPRVGLTLLHLVVNEFIDAANRRETAAKFSRDEIGARETWPSKQIR